MLIQLVNLILDVYDISCIWTEDVLDVHPLGKPGFFSCVLRNCRKFSSFHFIDLLYKQL